MNRALREFPCVIFSHEIGTGEFILESVKLNHKILSTMGWDREKFISSILRTGFPE